MVVSSVFGVRPSAFLNVRTTYLSVNMNARLAHNKPKQRNLCIESSTNTTIQRTGANNGFQLFMDSIELYVVNVEQTRVNSLDRLIDLKEVACAPYSYNNSWTSNV
jgi:hypothetical protein